MTRWTRRDVLACSAAWLATGHSACAPKLLSHPPQDTNMDLLDDIRRGLLAQAPQEATAAGIDHGEYAPLRCALPDRSVTARRGLAATYQGWLDRLSASEAVGAQQAWRDECNVLRHVLELAIEGSGFGWGDASVMAQTAQENTPYVVNQMIGGIVAIPQLLASQQPLQTSADLDAFQQRWAALAPMLDEETQTLQHDASKGVLAPRFVLQALLRQIDGFLSETASQQRPVLALARATDGRESQGAAAEAGRTYEIAIRPAALRQREAVLRLMDAADDRAGVQHLPDGERYYDWALRVATGTAFGADEIHRMGQEQQAEIEARMDSLLRAQGLIQGSVGQRMAALANEPAHRFDNTDAGRAQAIAYCNRFVDSARALMPRLSHMRLRAPVKVERVPAAIESGQAGAYMSPGSADGSRPAVFYLNLSNTADWPRWALPTLVAHEAVPGHVWQEAYEAERAQRHPVRSLIKFNGFAEGWALYAEALVDEAGLYDAEPLAHLGYLQAQMLRATRLVVDTGLHARGWSREQAIRAMADATGRPASALGGEVDRYCVKPGQACGYMVGQLQLMALRAGRQKRQGERFDLAAFNDAVVQAGHLPMNLLADRLNPRERDRASLGAGGPAL